MAIHEEKCIVCGINKVACFEDGKCIICKRLDMLEGRITKLLSEVIELKARN